MRFFESQTVTAYKNAKARISGNMLYSHTKTNVRTARETHLRSRIR